MKTTGLYFDCVVDDLAADTFSVTEFTLDEALSELFTLTLTVTSFEPDIDVSALILRHAHLTVYTNGEAVREVVGIITEARQGKRGFRQSYYTLIVRPPMWLLTQRQQSRIFHFNTLPEVLNTLLQEHQIRYCCDCRDTHSQREFITQKRESDYAFFCRLAAEEGITFWFEVSDGQVQCLYTDSFLSVLGGDTLTYNDHAQNSVEGHFASHIHFSASMTPQAAMGKDRTYLHPRYAYQHKAEHKTLPTDEMSRYTIYDSYARFPSYAMAQAMTQYRLDALQNQSEYGEGRSNSFLLRPGYFFKLSGHPSQKLNQKWQITSVRHHGILAQSGDEDFSDKAAILTNDFSFIDYFKPWRPPFIHKPTADGPEVAEVVGPEGEEIYTNKLGQVKVHFHWNLQDKADEKASCWVRVMQGWSGNGYGFYAVPRIGQEVIVSYLNGDIDQPIITGCTYHDVMALPIKLPDDKTQTVFRTQTHKGKGNNELRFDDKRGEERVFIQSQKDFEQLTLHDHTVQVKHNSHLQVDNEHSETVSQNRYSHSKAEEHCRIDLDRKTHVMQNDHKTVAQSEHTQIGTIKTLEAGQEIHLKAGMNIVIDGGLSLSLKAGGQHIVLNPAGIWMSTPSHLGGAPSVGTQSEPLLPIQKNIVLPPVANLIQQLQKQAAQDERLIKFNIRLQDTPGRYGFPLSYAKWEILHLPEGPSKEQFGHEHESHLLLSGEADQDGKINFSDQDQALLSDHYKKHPHNLWLKYPGHLAQIVVYNEQQDCKEQQALDSMGFLNTQTNLTEPAVLKQQLLARFVESETDEINPFDVLTKG